MIINMGPQHPATHGVLRLELVVDGEIVQEVIPHIGYLHRCFEKHCEHMTNYQQVIPYVDRMDYCAAMNNEFAYVVAAERLLKIEVPERVQYIRVIMAELNRIASHLIAVGTYGIDIGAFTPFLYCFIDREMILDLFEMTCGARLLYNYMWIGGLSHDLPPEFIPKAKEFCRYYKKRIEEFNNLLTFNEIFVKRTASVGVLPKDVATNYGCTGPMLRGSGVDWDLRRDGEPRPFGRLYDLGVRRIVAYPQTVCIDVKSHGSHVTLSWSGVKDFSPKEIVVGENGDPFPDPAERNRLVHLRDE